MTGDQWFLPSHLSEKEKIARTQSKRELGNDFGSYAVINETNSLEKSAIESHNLIHADARVRLYRKVLPRKKYIDIADIGCGIGMTASSLARRFPGARVIGYEISHDAVTYATRMYPHVVFEQKAIAPDGDFGRNFDLILCQEFYPFTRTSDWEIQHSYILGMLRHLRNSGLLAIELSERSSDRTILANLDHMSEFRMSTRILPFDKIFRIIPILWIADLLSAVVGCTSGRERNVLIVIEKEDRLEL